MADAKITAALCSLSIMPSHYHAFVAAKPLKGPEQSKINRRYEKNIRRKVLAELGGIMVRPPILHIVWTEAGLQ